MTAARRVLLKVSGESFGRDGAGVDPAAAEPVIVQIAQAINEGIQVAVVVGGGNIVRGAALSEAGVERGSADYMGMLATVINGLGLQAALEGHGCETRVLSAIEMSQVAEPFIRRRAVRHLEKGRVVILAGGTGNPYFTTDTTAALRATELSCDVLLKATRVDGVFTADPEKDPEAEIYESLTYLDVINQRLRVMDTTAITMCMENGLPIVVFNMAQDGNVLEALRGRPVGTTIGATE